MFYNATSTDLQSLLITSSDWFILLIVSCIIALGTFVVYRFFKQDLDKTEKSVMIKIDRNGKHRYEIKENFDNDRMIFWMKVVFAIIAIALFFIPIHSWLYKS